MGPPLIGETVQGFANVYGFLDTRRQRYGNTFKSSLTGRKVVILAGTEGAEAFYSDNISRVDAAPFQLASLLGGTNMGMIDGDHRLFLKSATLRAFDHASITNYLPQMQELIEAKLSGFSETAEFSAVPELRRLAIEVICRNILGLTAGSDTDAITRDYDVMLQGITALPLPSPVFRFGRATAARDRLLARIQHVVRQRREHPGSDGLSRLLSARDDDGAGCSDREAVLEVHHMFVAGFLVYGLMAEVLRQLSEQPQLLRRCAAEAGQHAPTGPLTMAQMEALQATRNVVREAKRYVPLVPLAFGRARNRFTCGGFDVPAGWTVWLALHLNNHDPAIYADPQRFDPGRFDDDRAEHRQHPMAFIPQGAPPATGHQCLGLDYSTILMLAFTTLLVRGYAWELPQQDLTYIWRRVPPEVRSGLRVRMRRRSPQDPPAVR